MSGNDVCFLLHPFVRCLYVRFVDHGIKSQYYNIVDIGEQLNVYTLRNQTTAGKIIASGLALFIHYYSIRLLNKTPY